MRSIIALWLILPKACTTESFTSDISFLGKMWGERTSLNVIELFLLENRDNQLVEDGGRDHG